MNDIYVLVEVLSMNKIPKLCLINYTMRFFSYLEGVVYCVAIPIRDHWHFS